MKIIPLRSDVVKIFGDTPGYFTREYFQIFHGVKTKKTKYVSSNDADPFFHRKEASNLLFDKTGLPQLNLVDGEDGSVYFEVIGVSSLRAREAMSVYKLMNTLSLSQEFSRELLSEDFSVGLQKYEEFKGSLEEGGIRVDERWLHFAYFIKLILNRKVLPEVGSIHFPFEMVRQELDDIDQRKAEIVQGIDGEKYPFDYVKRQQQKIRVEKAKLLRKYYAKLETYANRQWHINHQRDRETKKRKNSKNQSNNERFLGAKYTWTKIKSLRGMIYKSWVDKLCPFFMNIPQIGSERKALICIGLLFDLAGFNDLRIKWQLEGHYETTEKEGDEMEKQSFVYYLANTFKKIKNIEVEILESPSTTTLNPDLIEPDTEILPHPTLTQLPMKGTKRKRKGKSKPQNKQSA